MPSCQGQRAFVSVVHTETHNLRVDFCHVALSPVLALSLNVKKKNFLDKFKFGGFENKKAAFLFLTSLS